MNGQLKKLLIMLALFSFSLIVRAQKVDPNYYGPHFPECMQCHIPSDFSLWQNNCVGCHLDANYDNGFTESENISFDHSKEMQANYIQEFEM